MAYLDVLILLGGGWVVGWIFPKRNQHCSVDMREQFLLFDSMEMETTVSVVGKIEHYVSGTLTVASISRPIRPMAVKSVMFM